MTLPFLESETGIKRYIAMNRKGRARTAGRCAVAEVVRENGGQGASPQAESREWRQKSREAMEKNMGGRFLRSKPLALYIGCFLVLCLISLFLSQQLSWYSLFNTHGKGMLAHVWLHKASIFIFIAMIAGVLQTMMLASRLLRGLFLVLYVLSLTCGVAILMFEGRRPLPHDMDIIINGLFHMKSMPLETLAFFWKTFLPLAAVIAGMTIFLIFMGRTLRANIKKPVSPAIVLTIFLGLMFLVLLPSQRIFIDSTPVYARNILYAVSWFLTGDRHYGGKRASPELAFPENAASVKHIIYIMDESVGGKYLGINGYPYPTTPFLAEKSGEYLNYGEAASASNQSNSSNIICVSGLRPDQLPDSDQRALKQASIFDYANLAGRKSYYVDAQRMAHLNHMKPRDMISYDYIMVHSNHPGYMIDMDAVEKIGHIIDTSEVPTFIYLLKFGCHFNYRERFNPDADYTGLQTDGPVPEIYHKALRWSVDEFFHVLVDRLSGRDVLIVYTSDHGQSFTGGDSYPHATLDSPSPDQANVPILLWPMSERARDTINRCGGYNASQRNRASQYQIFPTLLELMGYRREEVIDRFGKDLFGEPPAERVFISGDPFYHPTSYTKFNLNVFPTPD